MRAFAATCFSLGISKFFPEIQCRFPADGRRRVVLTFDDGPTAEGTSELRDVLEQHGIRALFFLVGSHAEAHPAHVRGLIAAGHLIGNHSLTHIDAWRASRRKVLAEMNRTATVLEDLTGRSTEWVRPPYGRITLGLLKWSREHRQRLLLWDVMPPDFEHGTAAADIAEQIERQIRPGSVICLHDNAASRHVTPAALRICLPRLQDAGWEFCLPAA